MPLVEVLWDELVLLAVFEPDEVLVVVEVDVLVAVPEFEEVAVV